MQNYLNSFMHNLAFLQFYFTSIYTSYSFEAFLFLCSFSHDFWYYFAYICLVVEHKVRQELTSNSKKKILVGWKQTEIGQIKNVKFFPEICFSITLVFVLDIFLEFAFFLL